MVPPSVTPEAVVIGASAGAVAALGAVLPALRADGVAPVAVVVHLPAGRPSLLVELFAPRCALPVGEAQDKQPMAPGIWFAPPDYHLLVEADRSFALAADEPVNFSRPSVDVLFESAAHVFGAGLVGVVLTGASDDGARGAKAIRDAGGLVIVQDPRTAEARVMPDAAILAARPQLVAPLETIASTLAQMTSKVER